MAINKKKLLGAFKEQIEKVQKRCPGYSEELLHTVADIVDAEASHQIQATNIQQKVSDCCSKLGRFLDERIDDGSEGEKSDKKR